MKKTPVHFVTWFWDNPDAKHRDLYTYTPNHIINLYEGVKTHYKNEFKFTVITDQFDYINSTVRSIYPAIGLFQLWDDIPKYRCYPRLKIFAKEAEKLFGPSIVSIDLDMLILGDITALIDSMREASFCAYVDSVNVDQFSCALMHLRPRIMTPIFDLFTCVNELDESKLSYIGSDQGWINTYLGGRPIEPNLLFANPEAVKDWRFVTDRDDVYDISEIIKREDTSLPAGAKIVMFNGMDFDITLPSLHEKCPWILDHLTKTRVNSHEKNNSI